MCGYEHVQSLKRDLALAVDAPHADLQDVCSLVLGQTWHQDPDMICPGRSAHRCGSTRFTVSKAGFIPIGVSLGQAAELGPA